MTLLQRLKSGWTTLKFIRVGLGGLILYSSIQSGDVAGMILGGLFTLVSLITDGICGCAGTCYTTGKSYNKSSEENIDYEELGVK